MGEQCSGRVQHRLGKMVIFGMYNSVTPGYIMDDRRIFKGAYSILVPLKAPDTFDIVVDITINDRGLKEGVAVKIKGRCALVPIQGLPEWQVVHGIGAEDQALSIRLKHHPKVG